MANTTVVVDNPQVTVVSVGMQGPAGAGGTADYIRPTAVPTTVGGATAGTTFTGTIEDALDTILYPYQAPAFSSFGFTQTSPLEVGATLTGGAKSFTWSLSNIANAQADSLSITDITTATALGTSLSLTPPSVQSIASITNTTATSHTWQVAALNTHSSALSSNFTVSWQFRTWLGESALTSLTSADILGLRSSALGSSFSGTKAFVAGGYKYMCYPTTFGLKTSFKDTATNLDVAMLAATTVSVTNSFGVAQNYYVHRTLNQLGGAINIAVA